MAQATYIETFDDGPGGWLGWISNAEGPKRLWVEGGTVISESPWWIDYNHAPPGAGYLNLLFALHTQHGPDFPESYKEVGGPNGFVRGGFPTDFTNARITVRLKGQVELRRTQLFLLVQANVGGTYLNHVLTGQPIQITSDWSEQTITLNPDPECWVCMGSRHDRTDRYGWGDVDDVLRNLNANIIFVLYPVDVVPKPEFDGNPHLLKAGEDYAVDPAQLPAGFVMFDEVRIEFPDKADSNV